MSMGDPPIDDADYNAAKTIANLQAEVARLRSELTATLDHNIHLREQRDEAIAAARWLALPGRLDDTEEKEAKERWPWLEDNSSLHTLRNRMGVLARLRAELKQEQTHSELRHNERDEAREAARHMHEEVCRLQALLDDAQGVEPQINGVAYAAEIELPWLEEDDE